jgi:hypothetical protein
MGSAAPAAGDGAQRLDDLVLAARLGLVLATGAQGVLDRRQFPRLRDRRRIRVEDEWSDWPEAVAAQARLGKLTRAAGR